MTRFACTTALGAFALSLAACSGGGDAGQNSSENLLPGQSVNAADGIDADADASGTTGSSTGDVGGPLNVAGDAENDSAEANGATNAQ